MILVETTVPPGTCSKIVKPILLEELKKEGLIWRIKNRTFIRACYAGP